jgi:TetR/AcrR family transcriptional regulator
MAHASKKRAKKTLEGTASKGSRGGRVAVRLMEAARTTAEVPGRAEHLPRPRRRGMDVRERILKVALEYFGAFGFEGTSTRAVAEQAGVTHTLVLYHFRSKDKLWIATVEDALKSYAEALAANIATAPSRSARDALTSFVEQFVRMSACHPQIHRLMTMHSTQGTKRLEWIIDHFLRGHFTFIRDLIRRGQAEGSVRQCDPARLYYLIIGAGGTPFTLRTEYKALTDRDVFSEAEILRNIAFIYEIVFI